MFTLPKYSKEVCKICEKPCHMPTWPGMVLIMYATAWAGWQAQFTSLVEWDKLCTPGNACWRIAVAKSLLAHLQLKSNLEPRNSARVFQAFTNMTMRFGVQSLRHQMSFVTSLKDAHWLSIRAAQQRQTMRTRRETVMKVSISMKCLSQLMISSTSVTAYSRAVQHKRHVWSLTGPIIGKM